MLNTFTFGTMYFKSCVDSLKPIQNEPFLENSLHVIGISTYFGSVQLKTNVCEMSANLKAISSCITVYVSKYALRETEQSANYHNTKRAKTLKDHYYIIMTRILDISISFHFFFP